MLKQNSLSKRDITYIYEDTYVWVHINSIKKKHEALFKKILEYYKNKTTLCCFLKGKVINFVTHNEAKVLIYISENNKEDVNNIIIENVKYLLPIDTNFGCSDNTELIYLNPPNLLENIYQRYMKAYSNENYRNCIYTYVGYILLSVNPYENFDIYNEKYMEQIKDEDNLFNIPHPFAIANDTYLCLLKDKINQSIIISGESGSGKTESSKQILKYLTYLSSCKKMEKQQIKQNKNNENIYNSELKEKKINTFSYEEKIQNSNPILESFGNAKTIKNDNSSRFGKLMKLNYDKHGILQSAFIETYLLAKSRVVDVPVGESNYHIFYSLCENEKLKKHFDLLPWYEYNYLKSKDNEDLENADEDINKIKIKKKKKKENYDRKYNCLYDLNIIIDCFYSIGIFDNEQNEIYKTLIAILLLGNVDFIETEEGKPLKIKNIEICKQLNKILELDPDNSNINKIIEILTIKKVRETQKNYTYQQAIYNRDVIAKALYYLLFEYIIFRVNHSLNEKEYEQKNKNENETEDNTVEYEIESDLDNIKDEIYSNVPNMKKVWLNGDGYEQENENNELNNIKKKRANNENIILLNEKKKKKEYFIGILDIYGFENFSLEGINGYEQLCINYANEILHSFFLKQIIENEHKIHCEENLNIGKFPYNDNSIVVSLIGGVKDISIYTILEDLALLPSSNKTNEQNKNILFFEKLKKNVINSAKYKNVVKNYNLSSNTSFIISHYAGDVLYDCSDFVNKNMDVLTTDIENFLINCNSFISENLLKRIKYDNTNKNEMQIIKKKEKVNRRKLSVKEMIFNHESEHKNVNMNVNVYKNKVKSIFSYFKKQLELLTNELEKTSSKFIRCIKPNHFKESRVFDKNLVLNQLVMSGMVDILNLMKNGYPCRVLYDDIWINYNNIIQDEIKEFLTPKMFCEIVLKFLQISDSEYIFGKTKVFFRFGVLSTINEILNKNETKKKEFIECVYKFWRRRRNRILLNFILYGCRFKILIKKRRAKFLMESGIYLYNNYLFEKQLQNIQIILFYYFNVYKTRCHFLQLKKCTLFIQKNVRRYLKRKSFLLIKNKILFIQDYYLFHKYLKKRIQAANIIRKYWICYVTRYDYLYVLDCIKKIQRCFKKYMKKKYINYCLKIVKDIDNSSKTFKWNINNTYVNTLIKKEIEEKKIKPLPISNIKKNKNDDERINSFIYVENKQKKRRHSVALGELSETNFHIQRKLKGRKTWAPNDINNYEYNTVHTFKYKHQNDFLKNDKINRVFSTNHDTFHNETLENKTYKNEQRNHYNEDKPIISIGNTIINNKQKELHLSSKRNINKKQDKPILWNTNNSICSSNHINLKKNVNKNLLNIPINNINTRKRRSTYNNREDAKITSKFKRNTNNISTFKRNTSTISTFKRKTNNISKLEENNKHDKYIQKNKYINSNNQIQKKKRPMYIKDNYSNISNIYNVYKPTQIQTQTQIETHIEPQIETQIKTQKIQKIQKEKDEYNFDLTDMLIIPEDFVVFDSNIPEPQSELANHENYLMLCQYLNKSIKSKIPIISLETFKVSNLK